MGYTHLGFYLDEMIIAPSNITVYNMLTYCFTGLYKVIIFICNLVGVNNITAIGGGKIHFLCLADYFGMHKCQPTNFCH